MNATALSIRFRAKVETVRNIDDSIAYRRIKVPKLTNKHCDMHAFRASREFGAYANSDLFPAMLARKARQLGIGDYLRLHELPECVSVDESGFLAVVTIAL